ncbi:MAG: undecaprenyl-diphosphate phosphatase [Bdellovibrionaceae bacterium]|nr:undecaprenyl-diphosphate phosphatase [Pseudobdellovibrionaceae bacterium]
MNLMEAIILGVIEGMTEFLPISSTGHMIIASHFLGIAEDQFVKNFEVIIQFGAILAVVFLYFKRFVQSFEFYKRLLIAFIPTGLLGFFLKKLVDQWLESVHLVATTLIVGGVVLIWCDKKFASLALAGRNDSDLKTKDLLTLGLWQSVALLPGVSRSGATILGGLFLKMNRKSATEFSFFLAVPTMAAATTYKLFKSIGTITSDQVSLLGLGFVISFLVAALSIQFFLKILAKSGFKYFGIYRIVVGLVIFGILTLRT